uniref:Variant surface glycoprotein 1125.1605 n=1 Tax=Trypanosoma brucei TaxID=5691 RepID=A0A1J0R7C5_9TRYP|nr:variant surface glycoprotein 1125.1605 [Trypanosoma brucei]
MLFQLMLTGALLYLVNTKAAAGRAPHNCSAINDAHKYAAELIKYTVRAYRQQKSSQTMLHQLQVYTVIAATAKKRCDLMPLTILLTLCAAGETEAAANLEKEAQKNILNLAQALGTSIGIEALAAAEIDGVANPAHGNSVAYKKVQLKSDKAALPTTYCPIGELIQKAQIPGTGDKLTKLWAEIKKTAAGSKPTRGQRSDSDVLCRTQYWHLPNWRLQPHQHKRPQAVRGKPTNCHCRAANKKKGRHTRGWHRRRRLQMQ